MKILMALSVFVPMFMLAGCATTPYPRLNDGAPVQSTSDGFVAFSQVKANKDDYFWEFAFRSIGARKGFGVGREMRFPNGFYDLPCDRLGAVWLMRVKPGEYQFGPWFIPGGPFGFVGEMVADSINRKTFAPGISDLSVRPNEIVYLGELSIEEGSNNGALVADRWDCDWPYIKATWPDAEALPMRKEIAIFKPITNTESAERKAVNIPAGSE